MYGEMDLDGLIGSRICHDLISPLGAIGNGVELLSMAGLPDIPELTLISESVDNANARIRFFRIAFGAAQEGSRIGNSELRSVLADLYRGNRLIVEWRVQQDVDRAEAKLAFLALQCLESALPWGGRVKVTLTDDRWNLFSTADRLKIDAPLWEMLTNPRSVAPVQPSNVHFALIHPAASKLGRRVATSIGDTSVSISF